MNCKYCICYVGTLAVISCIYENKFWCVCHFAGRMVDYGYATPKIYNYTFYAGSTCASPDADIKITDDMISEKEESFEICIVPFTLPFGVKSGGPATIIIRDNDSKYLQSMPLYMYLINDKFYIWKI